MGAYQSPQRAEAEHLLAQGKSYAAVHEKTGLGLKYLYRIFPKKKKKRGNARRSSR